MTLPSTLYLVLARCEIDDVVVQITSDEAEARRLCETTTPDDVFEIARRVYGLDTSIIHALGVVTFVDGKPSIFEHVKIFEGDEE